MVLKLICNKGSVHILIIGKMKKKVYALFLHEFVLISQNRFKREEKNVENSEEMIGNNKIQAESLKIITMKQLKPEAKSSLFQIYFISTIDFVDFRSYYGWNKVFRTRTKGLDKSWSEHTAWIQV